MLRKINTLLAALVLLIVSASTPVLAQTDSSSDEASQTTTTETTDDKSSGREARVKSYKEKAAAKLADAQAKRVKNKCKSAQGKISSLRAKVKNATANRSKVYKEVGEKLDTLLEKLKAAEVDTTKLETARSDIQTELATLTESLNAYDTVLADLTAMDCEADPDTFNAALISAREIQVALRTQAQEFRRFATTELRTILQELKQQMVDKSTDEQSSESTDTTQPTESSEGSNE
jgi:hypothetical protein